MTTTIIIGPTSFSRPSPYWKQRRSEKFAAAASKGRSNARDCCNNKNKDGSSCKMRSCKPSFRLSKNFHETDKQLSLSFDVPGVKREDLLVQVDNDILKIAGTRKVPGYHDRSFDRSIALDTRSLLVKDVKANLMDGVLVVTIPKIDNNNDNDPQQPLRIQITQTDHEWSFQRDNDSEPVKVTVEVPGVKISDLSVIVNHENVLTVSGERTLGVSPHTTLLRHYRLDHREFDMSSITANLADGLLVISLPKKEKEEARSINVTQYPLMEESRRKNASKIEVVMEDEDLKADTETEVDNEKESDLTVEMATETDDATAKVANTSGDWEKV